MGCHVGVFLEIDKVISAAVSGAALEGQRTSCSDSGTFCSFILCTPASARPSIAPVAKMNAPFILQDSECSEKVRKIKQLRYG